MDPKPNEIYQHFKGNLYKIVTLAIHSETREQMVVYQALYGNYEIYVRPLSMFLSRVDTLKYPGMKQEYRFERVNQIIGLSTDCQERGSRISEKKEGTIPYFESDKNTKIKKEETLQYFSEEVKLTEEELCSTESQELDPLLLKFLEAETYEDRLNILAGLHSRITDDMINTMGVVLDIEVPEGNLENRYTELKNCLITLEKFECNRLR